MDSSVPVILLYF